MPPAAREEAREKTMGQASGRTRVKICGITRSEDGAYAARCGADAIGLVFYPASPRAVDGGRATAIVRALPPFVTVVGLFVDPEPAWVRRVLADVPLDLLQFHGDEPPELCGAFGRPYLKAMAVREGVDLRAWARRHGDACGLLLDSYHPALRGGTGTTFDWSQVPPDLGKPVVLAGGLTPENVAEAVRKVRPYGVDVSGGVESEKGIKDPDRVAAFMRGVNSAGTS